MRNNEIEETKQLINLYETKIGELERQIQMLNDPELNMTRAKDNIDVKQTDFEYLLSLLEREVLATPSNRALHALGDEVDLFRSDYMPTSGIDIL